MSRAMIDANVISVYFGDEFGGEMVTKHVEAQVSWKRVVMLDAESTGCDRSGEGKDGLLE